MRGVRPSTLAALALFSLSAYACGSSSPSDKGKTKINHAGGTAGTASSGGSGGGDTTAAAGTDSTGGTTGGAATGGTEAGGGTGGSSGGSGGSSTGACPYTLPAGATMCACPDIANRGNCTGSTGQPILDDAEWDKGSWNGAPRGDFAGWWGHWMPAYEGVEDLTCFKKWEGWFPGNPELPMPNPFDESSISAMAIRGAGCTNADFYIDGLPDPGCANLSAFKGFTFDIMADHEMEGLVFVAQQDAQSHDLHTMPFTFTTEWQRIDVPFCALTASESLNAGNINALGFRASGDFDVYIDDIIFYE